MKLIIITLLVLSLPAFTLRSGLTHEKNGLAQSSSPITNSNTTANTTANAATVKSNKTHEHLETPCAFNEFGLIPSSPGQTFTLVQKPANYVSTDFTVKWHNVKAKEHPFFKAIGKNAQFRKAFVKMGCQIVDKATFGKICNYQQAQLDEYYGNAFGQDLIFKCRVPIHHFALNIRFVVKLSNFKTKAGGRWSVFGGVHKYKDLNDANKIIENEGKKIVKEVQSSKLNTFDINSELNIIPEFTKGTLAYVFNSNINSTYVQAAKVNTEYDLTDSGYLKILPPGTEFIIGSIFNGTTNVKQICDNYRFSEAQGCSLDLTI